MLQMCCLVLVLAPLPEGGSHKDMPPALPAAPAREDPSQLRQGPWRGTRWLTVRLDLVAPVAGRRPARGSILAASGGLEGGWRAHRMVGIYAGVSTFLHDRERETVFDEGQGSGRVVLSNGRMLLVDLAVVRIFVPTPRRVQPYFDVGGTLGRYRAPQGQRGRIAGGARFGIGVDLWLARTVSIGLSVDQRLLGVAGVLGYSFVVGGGLSFHG